MKNLTRTVWVGYNRSLGFMKGTTSPGWTDDFSKARLYTRECDVKTSARRRRGRMLKEDDPEIHPIKMELNLEREVAIILKLGGIPVQE